MGSGPVKDVLAEYYRKKMQQCIESGNYQIADRDKNKNFLTSMGYTIRDQKNILLQLTEADFTKYEVDRDDKESDRYWFYKTWYAGNRIYVKFKVLFLDGDFAYIKSLHMDEYPDN